MTTTLSLSLEGSTRRFEHAESRTRWLSLSIVLLLAPACGSVADIKPDAPPPDTTSSCVPESDADFCAAANACESHHGTDNCGVERTIDCGACGTGLGCVAGTCQTPVCTSFDYAMAPVPDLARSGVEDSIGGVTPDGQVILYVKTATATGCGSYHLVVADETSPGSGVYTQRDVSATFSSLGLANAQDAYAITADGLTIIAASADRKRLLSTKRSAIQMVDFGPASTADFDNVNAQTLDTSKIFMSPALSADGLELWYSLYDPSMQKYDPPYVSVRGSTSVPFPAGTAAPAPVSQYSIVEGISSDRLALFVFDNFTGRVLTRPSTSLPFANPNAPAAPPQIPAWQHKPLASCAKIVAMASPGGCSSEDVVLLTRQ